MIKIETTGRLRAAIAGWRLCGRPRRTPAAGRSSSASAGHGFCEAGEWEAQSQRYGEQQCSASHFETSSIRPVTSTIVPIFVVSESRMPRGGICLDENGSGCLPSVRLR